jgi:hypothetical protein
MGAITREAALRRPRLRPRGELRSNPWVTICCLLAECGKPGLGRRARSFSSSGQKASHLLSPDATRQLYRANYLRDRDTVFGNFSRIHLA